METIKKRILVETGYDGANVSCVATKGGLVLVDSPFLPKDARAWATLIREQTGQEVAYLINTDHHYDHVMGNAFLTGNVICHAAAAKGIAYIRNKEALKGIIRDAHPDVIEEMESDIDRLDIPSPRITFGDTLTLSMEDATFVLEFVGGHSPGTIIIYLEEEKTLFTGDNVEGQFPYFGQSRFKTWKETLQKMLTMDVDVVVPGHGSVGGREMIETYVSFFQELEEEVTAFRRQGLSIEEMAGKSSVINFFPNEEIAPEDMAASWIGEQYKSAARAILKDSEQK